MILLMGNCGAYRVAPILRRLTGVDVEVVAWTQVDAVEQLNPDLVYVDLFSFDLIAPACVAAATGQRLPKPDLDLLRSIVATLSGTPVVYRGIRRPSTGAFGLLEDHTELNAWFDELSSVVAGQRVLDVQGLWARYGIPIDDVVGGLGHGEPLGGGDGADGGEGAVSAAMFHEARWLESLWASRALPLIACIAVDLDILIHGDLLADDFHSRNPAWLPMGEVPSADVLEAWWTMERGIHEALRIVQQRGITLTLVSRFSTDEIIQRFRRRTMEAAESAGRFVWMYDPLPQELRTSAMSAHPFLVSSLALQSDDFEVIEGGANAMSLKCLSIAERLGIPPTSLLFLGASEQDRDEVRKAVPGITVPEGPRYRFREYLLHGARLNAWTQPMLSDLSTPSPTALRISRKPDLLGLREIRLAITANSSVKQLVMSLRDIATPGSTKLLIQDYPVSLLEHNPSYLVSDLVQFRPDALLMWWSPRELLMLFQSTEYEQRRAFADNFLRSITRIADTICGQICCPMLCTNIPDFDDGVYGSYANRVPESWPFQLRRANYFLMELATKRRDLFIVDLIHAIAATREAAAYDPLVTSLECYSEGTLSFPIIAKRILDVVDAIHGRIAKCLVLDLDNILWGGILSDDGMDALTLGTSGIGTAFLDVQRWVKELAQRGVILAVCSKNTDQEARDVFKHHPYMVLTLNDIAVFRANWKDKVDNLRDIQAILDISFESIVFLDDSAFEREAVRQALPEIRVPELPDDPREFVPFLTGLNLFETAATSADDPARTLRYQDAERRISVRDKAASQDEFLSTLGMVCTIEPLSPSNIARAAQLSQRTNQFNFRAVRYSEADLLRLIQLSTRVGFVFDLRDRIGGYGIVSAVVLEEKDDAMFIEMWVMSCRVFGRGLERLILDVIVDTAKRRGRFKVIGECVPTGKNEVAINCLKSMGFSPQGSQWHLHVEQHVVGRHHILRV